MEEIWTIPWLQNPFSFVCFIALWRFDPPLEPIGWFPKDTVGFPTSLFLLPRWNGLLWSTKPKHKLSLAFATQLFLCVGGSTLWGFHSLFVWCVGWQSGGKGLVEMECCEEVTPLLQMPVLTFILCGLTCEPRTWEQKSQVLEESKVLEAQVALGKSGSCFLRNSVWDEAESLAEGCVLSS